MPNKSTGAEQLTLHERFSDAKTKFLAGGVIVLGGIGLTACSNTANATPEHTTTSSASASHTPETKKPAPEYQKTPTAEQLSALYMPASATDEQLAQNAVNVSNLMFSGAKQGLVTLKETNSVSPDTLANEWMTPIFSDPSIFDQSNKPQENMTFWTKTTNGNFETYDGGSAVLETFQYDTYHSINDSPTSREIGVDFTFVQVTGQVASDSEIKNGQEGTMTFTYVPSADGSKWVISTGVMVNTNIGSK